MPFHVANDFHVAIVGWLVLILLGQYKRMHVSNCTITPLSILCLFLSTLPPSSFLPPLLLLFCLHPTHSSPPPFHLSSLPTFSLLPHSSLPISPTSVRGGCREEHSTKTLWAKQRSEHTIYIFNADISTQHQLSTPLHVTISIVSNKCLEARKWRYLHM